MLLPCSKAKRMFVSLGSVGSAGIGSSICRSHRSNRTARPVSPPSSSRSAVAIALSRDSVCERPTGFARTTTRHEAAPHAAGTVHAF
eukprot:5367980-Prymnesium_polylepis.1